MNIKIDKNIDKKIIKNDNKEIFEEESFVSKDFFNINDNNLLDDLFIIFSENYNISRKDIDQFFSLHNFKSKNQMKINMMKAKNELFGLLSTFCLHASFFRLNINFDYNMYEYSEIIKKFTHHVRKLENIDKEQERHTQNILHELISTECISDYGLIINFDFKYITNIHPDLKDNSIKYTMFKNITNKQKKGNDNVIEESKKEIKKVKKLVLKGTNILIDFFKRGFESDDFLNYNKLDSAFNFFLINSYYKYFNQISSENDIS